MVLAIDSDVLTFCVRGQVCGFCRWCAIMRILACESRSGGTFRIPRKWMPLWNRGGPLGPSTTASPLGRGERCASVFPVMLYCFYHLCLTCPSCSGADVFDRVSTFLETFYRDIQKGMCGKNTVFVSHGLFCRLFLTRFYHWTVSGAHAPTSIVILLSMDVVKAFCQRMLWMTSDNLIKMNVYLFLLPRGDHGIIILVD